MRSANPVADLQSRMKAWSMKATLDGVSDAAANAVRDQLNTLESAAFLFVGLQLKYVPGDANRGPGIVPCPLIIHDGPSVCMFALAHYQMSIVGGASKPALFTTATVTEAAAEYSFMLNESTDHARRWWKPKIHPAGMSSDDHVVKTNRVIERVALEHGLVAGCWAAVTFVKGTRERDPLPFVNGMGNGPHMILTPLVNLGLANMAQQHHSQYRDAPREFADEVDQMKANVTLGVQAYLTIDHAAGQSLSASVSAIAAALN